MKRSPLRRTGFINPISEKRRRYASELNMIRPKIIAKGCEFPQVAAALLGVRCSGALAPHHILMRSHGGGNEDANLMCLCATHHRYVHDNPDWSRKAGFLKW